jgi:hypothetical protein
MKLLLTEAFSSEFSGQLWGRWTFAGSHSIADLTVAFFYTSTYVDCAVMENSSTCEKQQVSGRGWYRLETVDSRD